MEHIVFLDAGTLGSDTDLSGLERFGTLVCHHHTDPGDLNARIGEATILISNKVMLSGATLAAHPRVKLICVAATGTNNVDLDYCRKNQVAVTNVAGYSTDSVAQHTFALLFSLLENLNYYQQYTRDGDYTKSPFFTNLDHSFWEVAGKTWGIIGLGAIGRRTAAIASAFGCQVQYYSTSGANHDRDYPRVDLDTLLSTSDVISIHSPLNARTRNLIGREQLEKMKPEGVLINVGRGGIANEEALRDALNRGEIRGYATDVLETEPMTPDCPLRQVTDASRLVITPHIAWAGKEARARLTDELILNIGAFLEGRKRNRVD